MDFLCKQRNHVEIQAFLPDSAAGALNNALGTPDPQNIQIDFWSH